MTVASRPEKLSHAQTMLYEIDMLRETGCQLEKDKWQGEFHKWVVLEAFLLHFRNLIEFFGRPDPKSTLTPGDTVIVADKIAPFEPLTPGEYKLHLFLFSRYATELNKPEQELTQAFSVVP